MSLLIKHGEVITAAAQYPADLWIADETITAIGRDLPAPPDATVIDATGCYVFPGFIDPHVHIYLPFMGTYAKDTHATASRAALVGGNHLVGRDDLSDETGGTGRSVRALAFQGRRADRLRLHIPHGRESLR